MTEPSGERKSVWHVAP